MTIAAEKQPDLWSDLFPDRQRHPYYIVAPAFTRYSAGIKVLHTLCHLLNLRGQTAFVVASEVNPDLVTPQLTSRTVDLHFDAGRTPVIIYPERFSGNPLGGPCVVRYLLNVPALLGVDGQFGSNDILVWYSEYYRRACGGTEPILSIPTSDPRLFSPPATESERRGSCFYAAKYKLFSGEDLKSLTANSIEIPHGGDGVTTQEQLAELFQHSEVFYAYEPTALGLEATLCGCPCINLPSKFFPRSADDTVFRWPGMAWADDPDPLAAAKQTVRESRSKYAAFAEECMRQLDGFIDLTQERARNTAYHTKITLLDPHAVLPAVPTLTLKRRLKFAAKGFLGRQG